MKVARPGLMFLSLSVALSACAGSVLDGGEIERDAEPRAGSSGAAGSTGGAAGNAKSGQAGSSSPPAGSGGASTAGAGEAGAGGTAGSTPAGAGAAGATHADAGTDVTPPQPQDGVATIVAVGYAGRRTVSRDMGKTWEPVQVLGGGGDDQFLLRDAAFGAGRVVALGWKFLTSPDGVTWTEVKNPHGQWQGGVVWGNGMFISSGGLGRSAKSLDGVNWTTIANAGNTHIRKMSFHDGEFWATGDSGTVYHTADGVGAWKVGGTFPAKEPVAGDLRARLGSNGVEVSLAGGAWRKVLDASWAMGFDAGFLPQKP